MGNVTSQVEFITPALASVYLMANKNNRPLKKNHVDYLTRLMEENRWMLNGEAIIFDDNGVLLNGQHRLTALAKAKINGIQMLVVRGVDNNSFATYDQGLNRTFGDVFSLAGIPSANKVSSVVHRYWNLHCGLSALSESDTLSRNATHATGKRRLSKQQALELYEEHAAIFSDAAKIASRVTDKGVKVLTESDCGSLAALLCIDYEWELDLIESFFSHLFTGYSSFNCIKALHNKLANSIISKTTKMTPRHKINIIAKTWNCFVTGKDTKKVFWREEEGKIEFKSRSEVINILTL